MICVDVGDTSRGAHGNAPATQVVVLRDRPGARDLLVVVANVHNGRAAKGGFHPLPVAVVDEARTGPAAHPRQPVLGVVGQGVGAADGAAGHVAVGTATVVMAFPGPPISVAAEHTGIDAQTGCLYRPFQDRQSQ
jgi:hypothetical protein